MTPRASWTFRVLLPPEAGDRFVARLLKHLWRVWRVRCVAVLDAPPPANKMKQEKPR